MTAKQTVLCITIKLWYVHNYRKMRDPYYNRNDRKDTKDTLYIVITNGLVPKKRNVLVY